MPPLSPYAYPPPRWAASPSEGAYAWTATPESPWPSDAFSSGPPEWSGGTPPARSDAAAFGAAELPPPVRVPVLSGDSIPNGEACLRVLAELPVSYEPVEEKPGILTAIRVTGPVAGIRYHSGAGLPFLCDCRLAVALVWSAPLLRQLGVTDVRYSGVYVYRMSRVGRLSMHAYGLAIDLHEFIASGSRLEVEEAYQTGLADPCSASAPVLNRLACGFKALGLFKEVLTPDYNADHHDHFHLGLKPLDPAATNRIARARAPESSSAER
jgi:hypothetical protein